MIPPRKTAAPSQPAEELLEQRDAAIDRIAEVGRRRWRKESGAHRQARAENAMFRYKRLVGDRLRAKSPESQATEARIAVNVLDRMHGLGTPESEAVVAWQLDDEGWIRPQSEPCTNAPLQPTQPSAIHTIVGVQAPTVGAALIARGLPSWTPVTAHRRGCPAAGRRGGLGAA